MDHKNNPKNAPVRTTFTVDFTFHPSKAAKNLGKHRVSAEEAVTVFSDTLRLVVDDDQHSWDEERLITVGLSTKGRVLFIVYTETDSNTHLISARVATATERKQYEEVA